MAIVTTVSDVIVDIYRSMADESTIGVSSKYGTTPHPGTNKTIKGWEWNNRKWSNPDELNGVQFAPSIWDPTKHFVLESMFQSGIGDGNDLKHIETNKQHIANLEYWTPKLNHGYFYILDDEYYAYSDDVKCLPALNNQLYSGLQYVNFGSYPKHGIPITARRYLYDKPTGRYLIDINVEKVVDFTPLTENNVALEIRTEEGILNLQNIDINKDEFYIDYDTLTGYFNKDFSSEIGREITYISSGIIDPSDIDTLEVIGLSDGFATAYNTLYSPIDESGVVQLWVYGDPTLASGWTQLGTYDPYTLYGSQFKVDYELGIINFDTDGIGAIPAPGATLGLRYTKGISVCYEAENTRDTIDSLTANFDPLRVGLEKGFIIADTKVVSPNRLVLSSDLLSLGTNWYTINLGNNIGNIIATVLDASGNGIGNQSITFTLLDPKIGSFSTLEEISALSGPTGIARAIYSPPVSIDDFGRTTVDITYSGGNTILTVDDLPAPTDLSRIYLYQIKNDDLVAGIDSTTLPAYYTSFFAEEDITTVTNTQDYEETHREIHSLLKPTVYTVGDEGSLLVGNKVIVLSTSDDVIDPVTGVLSVSALAPLKPYQVIDTTLSGVVSCQLLYSGILPAISGNIKAYFAIGDIETNMIASVYNPLSRRRIYSNQIAVRVSIPAEANGVYFAEQLETIKEDLLKTVLNVDNLSDPQLLALFPQVDYQEEYDAEKLWILYSGIVPGHFESYVDWFRNTRRGDSNTLGLTDISYSNLVDARIPLGFRLKTTGITVASMLGMVTFYDPNDPLPDAFFSGVI